MSSPQIALLALPLATANMLTWGFLSVSCFKPGTCGICAFLTGTELVTLHSGADVGVRTLKTPEHNKPSTGEMPLQQQLPCWSLSNGPCRCAPRSRCGTKPPQSAAPTPPRTRPSCFPDPLLPLRRARPGWSEPAPSAAAPPRGRQPLLARCRRCR